MVICVQQNDKDDSNIDLDILQAGINLSGRDKFLCDRVSRQLQVAMKRLYQCHPVTNMCQEGVSKCSNIMGASFILILILYRIYSKRSRGQAARIKNCNRAAVVRAVRADKGDYTQVRGGIAAKPSKHNHEADCSTVPYDKAKAVDYTSKDHTVDQSNRYSHVMGQGSTTPTVAVGALDVRGHVRYLGAIIRQHLLLSGDVELNPGPLDGMFT